MRIFLTHILPEHLIPKYELSFAGYNFSMNLITGNGFDKVYSTLPLSVKGELSLDEDPKYTLVYSSLRKKGGILAKLSTFTEQWAIFKLIPKECNLWLYNISILNVLLYVLIRIFKPKVKINIIELDFTPPKSKWNSKTLYLYLLNHADGVIKLADSPLFTNKNSVCLAGVTPPKINAPILETPKMEFLLSGVLQPDISSIPMILDAFTKFPHCKLHITGKWSDMLLMNRYTDRFSNIIYHGIIGFDDYMKLLHSVTFVLSLRNPNWGDNQCNFPSKIIEALLHNRAVVSTIHYNQIEGLKYIETDRSVDGFINLLQNIMSMKESELLTFANQGEIAISKYSAEVWNEWMSKIEDNTTI